jgi:5-methylcytosine-specific restriction endonuclease McrA
VGKQKQLMHQELVRAPKHFQHKNNNNNNKTKSNKKKKNNNNNNPCIYNDLFYWAREIRMKYNYHCVYCNTSRKLSAHHIFPKAKYKGLKYNLNNGILMCYKCHLEVHQLNDVIVISY